MTKIILFSGFVGSGKTSLLLEFAEYLNQKNPDLKLAIVENEIGTVGIDDQMIKARGYDVRSLFAGCICCTMVTDLITCVGDLMTKDLDWIIIEATGLAQPKNIADMIEKYQHIKPRIVVVADPVRWEKLIKVVTPLLTGQINEAEVILINKTDAVLPDRLAAVEQQIQDIHPTAAIHLVSTVTGGNELTWEQIAR